MWIEKGSVRRNSERTFVLYSITSDPVTKYGPVPLVALKPAHSPRLLPATKALLIVLCGMRNTWRLFHTPLLLLITYGVAA